MIPLAKFAIGKQNNKCGPDLPVIRLYFNGIVTYRKPLLMYF